MMMQRIVNKRKKDGSRQRTPNQLNKKTNEMYIGTKTFGLHHSLIPTVCTIHLSIVTTFSKLQTQSRTENIAMSNTS